MRDLFKQSWFIRRLVYAVISVAGVVLFGLGMVTPDAFDSTVEAAGPAITLVVSAVTALAARKANPGSDGKAAGVDAPEVPSVAGNQAIEGYVPPASVDVPTLDDLRAAMGR